MTTEYRKALERRWRGKILELIHSGHHLQQSRLDCVGLWGMMRDVGQEVGLFDVRTMLQELADAGFVTFTTKRDDRTNEVYLEQIQITHEGRKIVQGYKTDELVLILR